jgi:hypothetical protein
VFATIGRKRDNESERMTTVLASSKIKKERL